MGPYTRFVRSEGERLADARDSLRRLREGLLALKDRVEGGSFSEDRAASLHGR
jgi:hypothetical protein